MAKILHEPHVSIVTVIFKILKLFIENKDSSETINNKSISKYNEENVK